MWGNPCRGNIRGRASGSPVKPQCRIGGRPATEKKSRVHTGREGGRVRTCQPLSCSGHCWVSAAALSRVLPSLQSRTSPSVGQLTSNYTRKEIRGTAVPSFTNLTTDRNKTDAFVSLLSSPFSLLSKHVRGHTSQYHSAASHEFGRVRFSLLFFSKCFIISVPAALSCDVFGCVLHGFQT